ncbi:spermidine synthase family protein [Tessaracoccus antarcticus]|uniref:Spermidine synthase n=1 Tax=Tessaracoccus antarcticus TaxID=2479848 RepID=A0A3M0G1H9_9ACTN|nr:spermidine synthase [Tessaracoccus antarcticus]RMB58774.1 spermidine synthase [Tessaracoccus antarcticus]
MKRRFEELDAQGTRLGLLTLRRRFDPVLEAEVYEVKLGDEFLMSSAFTVAERELALLGLAATPGDGLDVLVGGLGLGYTALQALSDDRVATLTVVDALGEVIGWHERGLLPETALTSDARTSLVEADFFALMRGDASLTGNAPTLFHAILLDVDHSPRHLLHPSHADLYTSDGLRALQRHLHPDGVFALWSDDPPDDDFVAALDARFALCRAQVITFPNALTRGESTATVYVASQARAVSA